MLLNALSEQRGMREMLASPTGEFPFCAALKSLYILYFFHVAHDCTRTKRSGRSHLCQGTLKAPFQMTSNGNNRQQNVFVFFVYFPEGNTQITLSCYYVPLCVVTLELVKSSGDA